MIDAQRQYYQRLRRTLDYIDRHLDETLNVDTLSRVAAFSKHHFHRQFTAVFGVPVYRYVQLARLKRASYRLLFRDDSVTCIALDAGYDAPEAFARSFKQRFGQVPSVFRRAPDWGAWLAAFEPLTQARTMHMPNLYTNDRVTIREVPTISVAQMTHRGDPAQLGATLRRFIAWRKAVGLTPRTSATYTIFHDPEPADPADFRIDLCAASPHPVVRGDAEVVEATLPGGRCAVLRVVGGSDDLAPAALFLYREWLPASGEALRDFPLYCQRVTFFPDVPEHEAVTDLFLPLH